MQRVATPEALPAALAAARAGDMDAAEKSLATVDLDELSSFDRGVAETTWAAIRYHQELYPQAREHLQAAVDTELMTQRDLDAIVGFIERLERMSRSSAESPLPLTPNADRDEADRLGRP